MIKIGSEFVSLHDLGQRLRDYRMAKGVSQKEVAKVIGVSHITIHLWELGRTHPMKERRQKVIGLLEDRELQLARGI